MCIKQKYDDAVPLKIISGDSAFASKAQVTATKYETLTLCIMAAAQFYIDYAPTRDIDAFNNSDKAAL